MPSFKGKFLGNITPEIIAKNATRLHRVYSRGTFLSTNTCFNHTRDFNTRDAAWSGRGAAFAGPRSLPSLLP
jgi:hypothetical protein